MSELAEEKRLLHAIGHDLILLLYGLTRSVLLYEANNATITKQIDLLLERLRPWFLREDEGVRFQLLSDEFFLNGKLLRADPRFWDRAVGLAEFLRQFEIGEIRFEPGIRRSHLQSFCQDLSNSARSQRNLLSTDGYGPLYIGESPGQSLASFDFQPDRFAIILCGSLLEVMEWVYTQKGKPGLSLLPLRRTLQLVIDAAAKDPAMFQIVAAVRDPGQPISRSRARLSTAIDTICFGHYLTLHRREIMCLAIAAVLSGVSDSDDPVQAVRPLFLFRGIKDAAMPTVLAVHDACIIRQGGQGGMAGHVLAVCQTYHQLTTAKAENGALNPAESLESMTDGRAGKFDRGTVQTFADYKGPYPLGSCVLLSNGAPAIVVAQGEGSTGKHRPTVMFYDGEGLYGALMNLAERDDVWIDHHASNQEMTVNLAKT